MSHNNNNNHDHAHDEDFVMAFQDGGFEMGKRIELNSVPEPSNYLWPALGYAFIVLARQLRLAQVNRMD